MKHSAKIISRILVLIQFVILILLLITGDFIAGSVAGGISQSFGIFLGIWSVIAMSNSKLSVFPLPRNGAKLITHGPYRTIRHPMYTSLFLIFTPLVAMYFSWLRVILLIILFITLWIKMTFEEKRLIEKFDDQYREYQKKTWQIIPFIF
ncbi:MAG TPA: isoprenylcysteine carboxylmethyltransferase family protein [Bacteroidia bacterium]|nr:isoprenylcysteine carboxylmethyltransferase family protein [Bacteroidia bacterium]HRS58591.1 isoprenylcysteine carboxylmethyltransferase family protein [Bacteroidia bacterium]HRU68042.1 isoprenylcysteine carboxylmethyltransferase family protein [Bacteroidia bacterium]